MSSVVTTEGDETDIPEEETIEMEIVEALRKLRLRAIPFISFLLYLWRSMWKKDNHRIPINESNALFRCNNYMIAIVRRERLTWIPNDIHGYVWRCPSGRKRMPGRRSKWHTGWIQWVIWVRGWILIQLLQASLGSWAGSDPFLETMGRWWIQRNSKLWSGSLSDELREYDAIASIIIPSFTSSIPAFDNILLWQLYWFFSLASDPD